MAYNFTEEEIKKAYDNLPERVQQFYSSEKTSIDIKNIGAKYRLHVDAIGKIGKLVGLAMMGLIPLSDFNRELTSQIGVSTDIANLIIYDLNQQVFSPIRKELEELTQGGTVKPKVTPTETIAPTNPAAPQVFDDKMHNVANVPKQEVAVTPQTGDNKVRDPYREPI